MILILGMGISTKGVIRVLEHLKKPYVIYESSIVLSYRFELIIKSPGVILDSKIIEYSKNKNVEIVTDVEFISRYFKRNYIGITGTNGKTTTSVLMSKITGEIACGNIGYSICDALMDHKDRYNFICELSSFQLEKTRKFAPYIACILNINRAHMDYHGDYQMYQEAKLNLVRNITDGYVVYNFDDDFLQERLKNHPANKMTFSINNKLATCFVRDKYIYFHKKKYLKIKKISLKGEHNLYNIMAAICMSKILDVEDKKIKKTIMEFNGVDYRNQLIKKNVYNDAKSTNPYSTLAALRMHDNCRLICGGYPRNEDLSILDGDVYRLNKVYCYGKGKDIIKEYMEKKGVKVDSFDTLEEACLKAKKEKKKIPLIYSPMMASFDQYQSYIERGKEFNTYYKKKLY